MFDPMILKLMNLIARTGITNETSEMLTSLFDTILRVEDFEKENNISNLQTLLLLLQDYDMPPVIKRLVSELRYKLIRNSLGKNWIHGIPATDYNLTEMNKSLVTKNEVINVYEDGFVEKIPTFSVQPLIPKDMWLLNDMGALALDY